MTQQPRNDPTQTASPVFHRDAPIPCLLVLASPDNALAGVPIVLPRAHLEIGRGDRERADLLGRRLDIADDRVSRSHAVLRLGADQSSWSVEDRSSKNGTWRNGTAVGASGLSMHDVLRVGDTLFLLCTSVLARTPDLDAAGEGLVGRSVSLAGVRDAIRQVGPTEHSVLVTGESGTGKELVAQALHHASRREGPFKALNSAAIPPDLVESEMFGVVRGAFSGAVEDRTGWIVEADGGTLFLDEIGDMPVAAQAKLLRVLETREVTPVGGRQVRNVDVRFIAATNQDIAERIEHGSFRQDLLHRLEQFAIRIPPLRERREDIPLLWEHCVDPSTEDVPPDCMANLLEALLVYSWPGNVRELLNAASQFVIRSSEAPDGGAVHHLPSTITDFYHIAREAPQDAAALSPTPPIPNVAVGGLESVRRDVRPSREQLLDALDRHDWNVSAVAREFGRYRPQVYRWMRYLGIEQKPDG